MGSKKYEAATQSARHLVHHPDELDGVREDVWGQPQISIQMSRKSRPSFSQDEKVIYRTPLSSLSHSENPEALDLLWHDLSATLAQYESPQWHERVLADRLKNPAPEKRLPINEAQAEVEARLDARRTQD